jgi:hypothetical protein
LLSVCRFLPRLLILALSRHCWSSSYTVIFCCFTSQLPML